MTREILIEKPSPNMVKFFDALKEKKNAQIKKLSEDKHCMFTINA